MRMTQARAVLWMLGPRAAVWLVAGTIASVALAGIELVVAMFLQLFLKTLGVLGPGVVVFEGVDRVRLGPWTLTLCLVTIAVVRASTQYLVGQSASVGMETITARLRRLAVWEMLGHPAQRFIAASSVHALVGEYFVKTAAFAHSATALLAATTQAVVLSLIMFASAWRESLVALLGLALLGAAITAVNRRAIAAAEHVPAELAKLTLGIERVARNFFLVRALRTQEDEHRQLRLAVDAYERHALRAGALANLPMGMTPFVGVLLILVVVTASRALFHTPGLALLSFLYLFMRFVQTISAGVGQLSACSQYAPQFRFTVAYVMRLGPHLASALAAPPARARSLRRAALATPKPPAFVARDVGFSYPSSSAPVLEGIDLEIPEACQFAIVGPSGSGKSTLLALLMGLLEPTTGEIVVCGARPRDYFADEAVRVGYVGAEPFLVAGSVRENLVYGSAADTPDEALWAALEAARLRSVIETLPERLGHSIGEDGSGLSAGQKQRLCLARALLQGPNVLVIDEVSANLDVDTESELAETLRDLRGVCTTLIVSHRPGILKYADRVVNLSRR